MKGRDAACTTADSSQGRLVAIALIPIVSSQIAAVGYDAATRELVIKFRASGRMGEAIYSYDGVPPELATGLIAAESPGAYFHRHIRQGQFHYRRHASDSLREDEQPAREATP
jgi:KTSC domain